MRKATSEMALGALVGALILAAACLPWGVERARRGALAQMPEITLTAVMELGLWTDQPVVAANVGRRSFRPATPVLVAGQPTRLRLQSADVVHTFSVPALGIDPVEIYPGRVVELVVTPDRPGIFEYYCTTVCGEPHFAMRGVLQVVPPEAPVPPPVDPRPWEGYWREPPPPAGASPAERGRWRYVQQGCVTCHGAGGRGGMENPNSMNPLVPDLASFAARTHLFAPEDVAAFLALLDGDVPLAEVIEAPEVPLFAMVRNQYLFSRELLRNGRASVALDPEGPRPPLDMPAWYPRLSDSEIEDILVYLLTLQGGEGDLAYPDHARFATKGASP